MFIQSVNDFHPFYSILQEELDNLPLLHFHEKWHSLEKASGNFGGARLAMALVAQSNSVAIPFSTVYRSIIYLYDSSCGPSVKESPGITSSTYISGHVDRAGVVLLKRPSNTCHPSAAESIGDAHTRLDVEAGNQHPSEISYQRALALSSAEPTLQTSSHAFELPKSHPVCERARNPSG
jgi:hypothetical protein